MQFRNNIKQRNKVIQGLRSFKDTLPKNIKKLINKRGHIFSETLNNWKHIAGEDLFKVCYPKAYRSSNKFGVSTLLIMVKRGHEIELEYSKKKIMDKMNFFFQNQVVERIKFKSFNDEKSDKKENEPQSYGIKNRFEKNLTNVENESLKKSLIELTKVFKTK